MRKKILSIYLAVAIGFLSVVASAVPVYASNSTNWEDYFSIKYNATATDAPYTLKFKSTTAQDDYDKLSKDERRKVDYDAFSAISAKDQQHKYDGLVLSKTSLPDFIGSIAKAAGVAIPGGISGGGGITADLQDKLTKVSNSIASSNRKFGGAGISFKASSKNPTNFGLGKITLTKDFINDVRANVATLDLYYLYAPLSTDINYYIDKANARSEKIDGTYKLYLNDYLTNSHLFIGYQKSRVNSNNHEDYSNVFYFFNDNCESLKNKIVLPYRTNDSIYLLTYDGQNTDTEYSLRLLYTLQHDNNDYSDMSSYTRNFSFPDYKASYASDYEFLGVTGAYCKVFKNKSCAELYLNLLLGKYQPIYHVSNIIVNNDYSTTVNKVYDYSSHDTYTTINNNVTQAVSDKGSSLTDEEYQKIVDDVMQKVQQEIDSKPDTDDSGSSGGGGTGGDTGGGSSGGDSGGSGTDSGESDTWLEKIFNRLGDILEKIGTVTGIETITEYIKQIADDVATLKEGGTLSADMSDTNGLLKDIKGLLGTLIAVQAVGDVADLLADTVGDKINDYADNLKSAVTEVADALQDVFPFSIPWDLMAILALFSAEAQAPVFNIPVNIPQLGVEHSIHIDLSDFESVSVICRAFLSVSFAVGLMYLTIRITGGKDDD